MKNLRVCMPSAFIMVMFILGSTFVLASSKRVHWAEGVKDPAEEVVPTHTAYTTQEALIYIQARRREKLLVDIQALRYIDHDAEIEAAKNEAMTLISDIHFILEKRLEDVALSNGDIVTQVTEDPLLDFLPQLHKEISKNYFKFKDLGAFNILDPLPGYVATLVLLQRYENAIVVEALPENEFENIEVSVDEEVSDEFCARSAPASRSVCSV